jgi:U4/U6.U5 tri-snRNP-associated protein 2
MEDVGEKVFIEETTTDSHFLQLTLEIPEKPLFRDQDGGLVIPQEPLVTVGVTFSDVISRNTGTAQRRKYALQKLHDYLILHLARF